MFAQRIVRPLLGCLLVLSLASCAPGGPGVAGMIGSAGAGSRLAAGASIGSAAPAGVGNVVKGGGATPTPAAPPSELPVRAIILYSPRALTTVTSPVELSGAVSITPFEATLVARVYDAAGSVIGEAPVTVAGELGLPGVFSGSVEFETATAGKGRVEVAELSAEDGSVVVSINLGVTLDPGAK